MTYKTSISPIVKTFTTDNIPSIRKSFLTSTLTLSITLALTALVAPAYADENRASAATIDTSAPIAALSKLSSLDNVKPLKVTVPTIEHFNTSSGVPVAFVRAEALPIVDIDLRVYKDMFIVSLRSLSDDEHLLPAVELMTQMLTTPSFDAKILARNKARLLVGLQQQKQDPGSLASIAFNQALYGTHPYAHPTSGTLDTVPSITQKDLTDFQKRYLVAANASLAITGNLTLSRDKKMALLGPFFVYPPASAGAKSAFSRVPPERECAPHPAPAA